MRAQRRFNYTNRKAIPREMFEIKLRERGRGEAPDFTANLELDSLDAANNSEVIVEAYHKATAQRFSFGEVGRISEPESTVLDEVDHGGRVLFRVKVVDRSGQFDRILASADRIAAVDDGDQSNRDFLVKVAVRDLGSETWKIDLSDDGNIRPELQLNWRIPEAVNRIRHDAVFQSLILPALVREVFSFIFWDCENSVDEGSWQQLWLDFGVSLTGRDAPDTSADASDCRDWVEQLCLEFSTQHGLSDRLVGALTENS